MQSDLMRLPVQLCLSCSGAVIKMSGPLDAIVIAGPTASGKTGLAVKAAKLTGGPVINADSMQVYDLLSVITARPRHDEMDGVEHLLFGHVPPDQTYSVAKYLEDAGKILAEVRKRGQIPVFAGGTGLYYKALTEGLAQVAEIDPAIRKSLRVRAMAEPEVLYRQLQDVDPDSAAQLEPGDMQRITRALEVFLSTGKTLNWWQNRQKEELQGKPLISQENCLKIVLLPERSMLREKIRQRFDLMIGEGGLEEVRRLVAMKLPDDLPVMRAIGVRQLAGYVRGEIELDEAVELAVHATRQYAKRQSTWFRNQFLARNPHLEGAGMLDGWHVATTPETAFNLIESVWKSFVNHNA